MTTGYTEKQAFCLLAEIFGKRRARQTEERVEAMRNILAKMNLPVARKMSRDEPCLSVSDMIMIENTVRAVKDFGTLLTRRSERTEEEEE